MTLRTHWKKWAYKRKNIVLIYSDDSFFCLSQCLMYHCLALRLCLLGAVEVRLTLGAALGHAQDSCVWPFTVHLPVLVAAGLRVPVPVSDSKVSWQSICGSFIHREVSHLGRLWNTHGSVSREEACVQWNTQWVTTLGPTAEMEDLSQWEWPRGRF